MKRLIISLLAATVCLSGHALERDLESMEVHKFMCQGNERLYYLYLPDGLPEDAPLVIYINGYGTQLMHQTEFYRVADKEKFAVCIPAAMRDTNGEYGWNVGYNMQKGYKVDDIKFLVKLAKHLQKEYGFSRKNVFLTGHSNGGEMCYLMAYKRPDFFKALAPHSGLTMKWMYDDLKPKKAVPLIEIHGTADDISLWNGVPDDQFWGPYISVPLAVANWAIAAGCDHETTERLPLGSPDAKQVIAHKFSSDTNGGVEVHLYEIIGCGHGLYTSDLDYAQTVWDFFSKYLE
ncbi:MAG: prolyl oligopeptidase family serine peptidase [Bacteroidales bacterium]|nr:prolyl oligopeptidase family serine peptidase [Bacteroidales bacterium]